MDNINLMLNSIEVANFAVSLEPQKADDILRSYDKLISDNNYYLVNKDYFNLMLNKVLFVTLIKNKKAIDLIEFKNLNAVLNSIISNSNIKNKHSYLHKDLVDKLNEKFGTNIERIVDINLLSSNIGTFKDSLVEVRDTEDELTEDLFGYEEVEDDTESINFYDILGEDETEEADGINFDDTDYEETDDINFDNIADENSNDIHELKNKTLEEKMDIIPIAYRGSIEDKASSIADRIAKLYASNFDAMPQSGILINNKNAPIVRVNASGEEKALLDKYTLTDIRVLEAVIKSIPDLKEIYNGDESIPSTDEFINGNLGVLYKLHLQFQSANPKYCTHRVSIRRWVTETKGVSNAEDWLKDNLSKGGRLSKFKDIKKWYKWVVQNILADAYIEKGLTDIDNSDSRLSSIIENSINSAISKVIVIKERNAIVNERGEKTGLENIDLEICVGKDLDIDLVINNITSSINLSGSSKAIVKHIAKKDYTEYKILTLSVALDKELAGKSDLFAYSIVDNLIESGQRPSWDHALLGKAEDGTYLFWDKFRSDPMPIYRCYTIYAGSRSGKGVMTSTLISSALCDGIKVFYTDGKPENGACLGEIAWREGKEAYIFDGKAYGEQPFEGYLEDYSFNVRQASEVREFMTAENGIPIELFEGTDDKKFFTTETQKKFLGVNRYLKSMALCGNIIMGRSKSELPSDDWHLWVFDEMTSVSNQEIEVREVFAKYVEYKTGKSRGKDPAKGEIGYIKEDDAKKDAGLAFIKTWMSWADSIISLFKEAAIIKLGKAEMNLIFIFQTASWIKTNFGVSTIAKVVSELKSTKIVGRAALADGCKEYGDAPTSKKDWYANKVNQDGGWWAISNSSDLRTSEVKIFKPYKVWTTPLIQGTLKKDPDGDIDNPKYLAGYIKKLTEPFGINAANVLNSAYTYAENAVNTLNLGNSLKEYIYNPLRFGGSLSSSLEELRNSYENTYKENNISEELNIETEKIKIDKFNKLYKISYLAKVDDESIEKYKQIVYDRVNNLTRNTKLEFTDDKIGTTILIIDNFIYLSGSNGNFDDIISNQNKKIVAGIILDTLNGNREYDEIPSKEVLESYIKGSDNKYKYTENQDEYVEFGNEKQTNYSSDDIRNFTSRVFSLVFKVKKQNKLTDEQAEILANTYIEKMTIR